MPSPLAHSKALLRRAVDRVLASRGYQLTAQTHVALGDLTSVQLMATHLRQLFGDLQVDGVVDVGANEGQYYDFLREHVAFTGHIVSFEPNPELAAKLKQRSARDPLWTVMDIALGSKEEQLSLKVMSRSGWSSLLDKAPVSATDRADSFSVEKVVPVQVRPLDAVLASLPNFRASSLYLKVDAQGFDLEVLKGAEQTIARAGALQTELELIKVYSDAPSYSSVLSFLHDRHYEITGVFPVWRDKSLRIGEMDTVLRNMQRPTGA